MIRVHVRDSISVKLFWPFRRPLMGNNTVLEISPSMVCGFITIGTKNYINIADFIKIDGAPYIKTLAILLLFAIPAPLIFGLPVQDQGVGSFVRTRLISCQNLQCWEFLCQKEAGFLSERSIVKSSENKMADLVNIIHFLLLLSLNLKSKWLTSNISCFCS